GFGLAVALGLAGLLPLRAPGILRVLGREAAAALAEGRFDGLRIHLDGAFEAGAVLEADPRRCDVAPNLRALADADTLRAEEVTFHVAFDVHGMREDIRADLALRADRQRVVAQLHRAVDLALDDEVFLAPQVPVDVDRRADDRRLPRDRRGAPRGGVGRGARLLALCRLALRLRTRILSFVRALLADIEHLVPPRCRRTSIER